MVSVSDVGLSDILADHETWARTGGSDGHRADLSGRTDLQAVNFTGVILENAVLAGADLRYATFDKATARGTDFDGACLAQAEICGTDLRGANLRAVDATMATFCGRSGDADLLGADLRDATLTSADLGDVKGLQAKALAGADLTLARLPADIATFKGIEHVSAISRHARANFLVVIAACAYCWLTIVTTTDAALLLNTASTPLPIIQTPVPLAGFYWAAPLLLFALYIYLHLYLQRMWEGLAALPARFPDGRSLDEHAYPWLLTGLVRAYVPKLQHDRPTMSSLQNGISILFAWGLVPLTLGLFWWRYLPRHDWLGTVLQIGVVAAAISLAWVSFRLARRTLQNRDRLAGAPPPTAWQFYHRGAVDGGTPWRGPQASAAIVLVMLVFSILAIEMPRTRVGVIDAALGSFGAPADLFEAEIAQKPDLWTRGSRDNVLPERMRLIGADLRSADAERAFLANVDLRGANLSRADLSAADLQSADLSRAWIFGADLGNASLVAANLWLANARFANLVNADLRYASLRGASIGSTNMENARLIRADLVDAGIRGARVVNADFSSARLQGADFTRSNLTGSRFTDAKLGGAIFYFANLTDTDLTGADLSNASISQDQLDAACGIRPPTLAPDSALHFTPRPCPSRPNS